MQTAPTNVRFEGETRSSVLTERPIDRRVEYDGAKKSNLARASKLLQDDLALRRKVLWL